METPCRQPMWEILQVHLATKILSCSLKYFDYFKEIKLVIAKKLKILFGAKGFWGYYM